MKDAWQISFTRHNPFDLVCSESDESWRRRVGIDKRNLLEARFNVLTALDF
jgi:hypothetical protein